VSGVPIADHGGMTWEGPTARRALPAWVIACVATLAGLTVAVAAHPGPLPGEVGVVRALQRLGPPVPAIAEIIQATTGTEGVLVAAALPIGWLLRVGGRPGRVVVAVVLMTILAVQPFFKDVIDRPRPSAETVDVRAGHESSSFPSGHSLGTTTVYGSAAAALWLTGRRRWAGVAAAPIVLTSCAAPVQGVHWPSDAVGGTLVGALAVWLLLPTLLQVLPGGARGRPPPGRRVR
jgi:undecaprenyl-diphosphatase